MFKMVGKYNVKLFDKNHNLVDEKESYNLITTKGRERVLDIWANHYGPDLEQNKNIYGFQEIDLSPQASLRIPSLTRKNTFFNIGLLADGATINCNAYDNWINGSTIQKQSDTDRIFIKDNTLTVNWGNQYNNTAWYWIDNYRHAIDFWRVDVTNEAMQVVYPNGNQNFTFNLAGTNLKFDYNSNKQFSLKLTNSVGSAYTYGISSDFTYDRATGQVICYVGKGIANNSMVYATYKFHDVDDLFADGVVGIGMNAWTNNNYDGIMERAPYTSFGYGRYSATGGETFEKHSWPFYGRPYEHYLTYDNLNTYDSNYNICFPVVDVRFTGKYDRYFMTYPYVMNKPTNFQFRYFTKNNTVATDKSIFINRWKLFKPSYQPQTPQAIAIGTDNGSILALSESNLALGAEVARMTLSYSGRSANALARWKGVLDFSEGNNTTPYKEIGVFYGDMYRKTLEPGYTFFAPPTKESCTNLFSRSVIDPWTKTAEHSAEITYDLLLT